MENLKKNFIGAFIIIIITFINKIWYIFHLKGGPSLGGNHLASWMISSITIDDVQQLSIDNVNIHAQNWLIRFKT